MQMDEEAAAIEEMQQAFQEGAKKPSETIEVESKDEDKKEEGRRPWQYVKIRVPSYQWDLEEGEERMALKKDTMPASLKEEQQTWWYDLASGGRNRIRLDFPLHLWGEIGNWWSKLKWGQRYAGKLKGVTWLELLVDFEIASGINCKRPQNEANWGARAELLRGIVKLILKVRGNEGTMETIYGTSPRITALAPFGAKFLSGLLRRPKFVAGEATIKAIAVNAWQWAGDDKAKRIQLHNVSYKNFVRGESKSKEVEDALRSAVSKATKAHKAVVRDMG
jgi:hypothetical protein